MCGPGKNAPPTQEERDNLVLLFQRIDAENAGVVSKNQIRRYDEVHHPKDLEQRDAIEAKRREKELKQQQKLGNSTGQSGGG